MNLIDKIFPKPQDLFNSPEDEWNKLLMEAAEENKEEVLPILPEEEWTNEDDEMRKLGIKEAF